MKSNKSYTYFEYLAAKLFFDDAKLHAELDNFHKNLNFHQLWEELSEKEKKFYRSLAYKYFYSSFETLER
jgi:hypothetical protein